MGGVFTHVRRCVEGGKGAKDEEGERESVDVDGTDLKQTRVITEPN